MDWPWAGSLYLQDPMGGFCQTNKVIPIGGKNRRGRVQRGYGAGTEQAATEPVAEEGEAKVVGA